MCALTCVRVYACLCMRVGLLVCTRVSVGERVRVRACTCAFMRVRVWVGGCLLFSFKKVDGEGENSQF